MLLVCHFLSLYLYVTIVSSTIPAPPNDKWDDEKDAAAFKNLLAQVDSPSLHEALHSFSPKKFKHGMFQTDHTAVEFIHKEEPSLATSIINLAKHTSEDIKKDLKVKRQNNGTTTTTTPAAHLSVTPVPPIASEPLSTSASETPTSTTSTISSNGSPVVGSTTSVVAGGSSTTVPVTSASTGSISLTAGEVITTTNDVGAVIVSTVGGSARTISTVAGHQSTSTNTQNAAAQTSVVVQTSTLPNGSKSVVTAVTVVKGGNSVSETPSGSAGVPSGTTTGSPGLQTGEAVMSRGWGKEMVLVVGGAVVVAGML
ncbi:hypothetical protein P7C71_g4532, partial [Lecanoromycetidae sp. Uapishka_2]